MKQELIKPLQNFFKRNLSGTTELFRNQQVNLDYLPKAQEILSNYQRQEDLIRLGNLKPNLTNLLADKSETVPTEVPRPVSFNFNLTPQFYPINNYSVLEEGKSTAKKNSATKSTNKDKSQQKVKVSNETIVNSQCSPNLLTKYPKTLGLLLGLPFLLLGLGISFFKKKEIIKHSVKECREALFKKKID